MQRKKKRKGFVRKNSNMNLRTLALTIKKPRYRNEAEQILKFKN